jgi:hypothetical protein
MNVLTFPRIRFLDAGLLLGAALAALTALAPSAHAAQPAAGFDRPASYDIRDVRSSAPVGAVAVTRTARSNAAVARDARCDVRDACSQTPTIAAEPAVERADANVRNPACDVRDVCTSTGTSFVKTDVAVRYSRHVTGGPVAR